MAELKSLAGRGVVVEYDFTAIDGSQILFDVARDVLAKHGVTLTVKLEALHLIGGNYQGAIAELFDKLGVTEDASEVAEELSVAFREALNKHVLDGVTDSFKSFIKAITSRGLKVALATRANTEILKKALESFDSNLIYVYSEISSTYGACKCDAWRRCCSQCGLRHLITVAVTGSGVGVKNALLSGLSVAAVIHDHVAYQDFGGADCAVTKFDSAFAKEIFKMLHIG